MNKAEYIKDLLSKKTSGRIRVYYKDSNGNPKDYNIEAIEPLDDCFLIKEDKNYNFILYTEVESFQELL